MVCESSQYYVFFFNDTATTEIYTLSLHDALPIWSARRPPVKPVPNSRCASSPSSSSALAARAGGPPWTKDGGRAIARDRKSTRLNSSHANISYAVFCLKKKKTNFCF